MTTDTTGNWLETVRQLERIARDIEVASGEFKVPIPDPGTDMARLLTANVIMRRENQRMREAMHAALRICTVCNRSKHPCPACTELRKGLIP